MSKFRQLRRRAALPAIIFAISASVYVGTLGRNIRGTSSDSHYVNLANSYLHGQLSVIGNRPPTDNDWAKYKERWYVSFPPLPAVILMPAVAAWGLRVWDRLFWAIFAGLGPAFLYLLLRYLRESGLSDRGLRDDLALSALFAFGTVYYFTSVQGTTWFAAHVVCCPLLSLYVLWSIGARRPLLAGLMLGLCFITRPSVAFAAPFFALEALGAARPEDAPRPRPESHPLWQALQWLASVRWLATLRSWALFSLPILAIGAVMMWLNNARFDDPFEFGHSYLQVRWQYRIQKWGLINYHYLSSNLAVFLASLPWITSVAPYLKISRHGLALWFTTPQLLLVLWPKRVSSVMVGLYISAFVVALLDLCYQNSGWIQFGYRFSLDYMAILFALLALGRRRFSFGFYALMAFAVAVNLFGAITFDRVPQYYDNDLSQRVIFQPD